MNPLSHYLSPDINRGAAAGQIKLYNVTNDLDGSAHGSPWFSDTFTIGASGSASYLPSETAVVATLKAIGRDSEPVEVNDNADPGGPDDPDVARDRPMQRATGRIYFGPLNNIAMTAGGRPGNAIITDLGYAFQRLQATLNGFAATNYADLCVWSRKRAEFQVVEKVTIDNSFDSQRRRGPAPTARHTVSL